MYTVVPSDIEFGQYCIYIGTANNTVTTYCFRHTVFGKSSKKCSQIMADMSLGITPDITLLCWTNYRRHYLIAAMMCHIEASSYLTPITSAICDHLHIQISYLIVGIGTKSYGFQKFRTLKINLAIGFIRKNQLECIGKAVMMLYLG